MNSPLFPRPVRLRHRFSNCRTTCARVTTMVLGLALLWPAMSRAEDEVSYRLITLADLFAGQTELGEEERERINRQILSHTFPAEVGTSNFGSFGILSLRMEDHVEGYLLGPDNAGANWIELRDFRLVLKFDESEDAGGFIDLSSAPGQETATWRLKINHADLNESTAEQWTQARAGYYQSLANSDVTGGNLFELLATRGEVEAEEQRNNQPWQWRDRGIDSSFEFFSGGRAVAENLALDEQLFVAVADGIEDGNHALDEIPGVTVDEFNWKPLLKDEPVKIDALASVIPHDQHVVFVSSVGELQELIRVTERELAPWIDVSPLGARSGYMEMARRYLRQMGLTPEALDELAPMVDSLALTGYDPFFALGTDVAILMRTDDPEALLAALTDQLKDRFGEEGGLEEPLPPPWLGDEPSGWRAWRNPSRTVSAHVVRVGDHVVLSNSEESLRRLHEVSLGLKPSLASLDEFRFFRQRYQIAEPETAFLYLSDATIRRWTGPAMRIGASRRTRAMAALTDLNLRTGFGFELNPIYLTFLGNLQPLPALGENGLHGGRMSDVWGNVTFLNPLVELELGPATDAERTAYETWRRAYESSWGEIFDPIALRVNLTEDRRELDLTVLPLIDSSQYQLMMSMLGDAKLDELAVQRADGTLLLLSLAIDPDGEMLQGFARQTLAALPGLRANPLGWMGGSVSLFIDQDVIWGLMAEADDASLFLGGGNISSLPVGARITSRNRVGLGLFLTAIKGFSEISAPGLLQWDPKDHNGQAYVSVGGRERMNELFDDIRVHYAAMDGALILALNEAVLHRAIEREQAFGEARLAATAQAGAANAGAGVEEIQHAYFEADPALLSLLSRTTGMEADVAKAASWQALPLLNALRRELPATDSQMVGERWMGAAPACPGGRGYQWNQEDFTYESVAFGHPGGLRDGDDIEPAPGFASLGAGLHFEHGGLRAKVFFQQASADTPTPAQRLGRSDGLLQQGEGEVLAEISDLWPNRVGSGLRYRERSKWGTDPEEVSVFQTTVVKVDQMENGLLVQERTEYEGGEAGENVFSLDTFLIGEGIQAVAYQGQDYSVTYEHAEAWVPSRLVGGVEYSAAYGGTQVVDGERGQVRGNVVLKVVGLETVEVEAGTFDECVRIDWTKIEQGDGEHDLLTRISGSTCYKPGIGIVRIEYASSEGDRTVSELIGQIQADEPTEEVE